MVIFAINKERASHFPMHTVLYDHDGYFVVMVQQFSLWNSCIHSVFWFEWLWKLFNNENILRQSRMRGSISDE